MQLKCVELWFVCVCVGESKWLAMTIQRFDAKIDHYWKIDWRCFVACIVSLFFIKKKEASITALIIFFPYILYVNREKMRFSSIVQLYQFHWFFSNPPDYLFSFVRTDCSKFVRDVVVNRCVHSPIFLARNNFDTTLIWMYCMQNDYWNQLVMTCQFHHSFHGQRSVVHWKCSSQA